MRIVTINLKENMPTVEMAKRSLSQSLRMAKAHGRSALKLIHGYGSSGQGGAIRKAVRIELETRKKNGMIKDFCAGEDFEPVNDNGRRVIELIPKLKDDIDYNKKNPGITIVVI